MPNASDVPAPVIEESSGRVDDTDRWIGFTLGNFRIERVLGRGAMGRVFLAQHRTLKDKLAAVKILLAEHALKDDVRARFEREAALLIKINDPNVIALQDFGVTTGPDGRDALYLVMEYVQGESLVDYLFKTPYPAVQDIFDIMSQIIAGMTAAHAIGVIHRDLKPENVYLAQTSSGKRIVKILDFGLGKSLGQSLLGRKLTQQDVLMGTIEYMAPEQARAEGADMQSDIYALGVMMYQMAAGKLPFDGEGYALLARVSRPDSRAIAPRTINPRVSPGLEQVIAKAMCQTRAGRYASIRGLAEDFSLVAKGQPPRFASYQEASGVFDQLQPLPKPDAPDQRRLETILAEDEDAREPSLPKWPFLIGGLLVLLMIGLGLRHRSMASSNSSASISSVPSHARQITDAAAPRVVNVVVAPLTLPNVRVDATPPTVPLVVAPLVPTVVAHTRRRSVHARTRPHAPTCGVTDPNTGLRVPCFHHHR